MLDEQSASSPPPIFNILPKRIAQRILTAAESIIVPFTSSRHDFSRHCRTMLALALIYYCRFSASSDDFNHHAYFRYLASGKNCFSGQATFMASQAGMRRHKWEAAYIPAHFINRHLMPRRTTRSKINTAIHDARAIRNCRQRFSLAKLFKARVASIIVILSCV